MVENPKLLSKMLKVQKKSSYLYQPGPYWKKNSLRTVREINKKGILNFRSFRNNAGQAFTDSPFVDIRPAYNVGARRVLFFLCSHIPLISKVFESQITLTTTLFKEKSTLEGNLLVQNPSVLASLSKIRIPRDSVRGGCETTSIIDGQIVSNYYIEQSFYVDKINQKIKLSDVRNYLEIGGGGDLEPISTLLLQISQT